MFDCTSEISPPTYQLKFDNPPTQTIDYPLHIMPIMKRFPNATSPNQCFFNKMFTPLPPSLLQLPYWE